MHAQGCANVGKRRSESNGIPTKGSQRNLGVGGRGVNRPYGSFIPANPPKPYPLTSLPWQLTPALNVEIRETNMCAHMTVTTVAALYVQLCWTPELFLHILVPPSHHFGTVCSDPSHTFLPSSSLPSPLFYLLRPLLFYPLLCSDTDSYWLAAGGRIT